MAPSTPSPSSWGCLLEYTTLAQVRSGVDEDSSQGFPSVHGGGRVCGGGKEEEQSHFQTWYSTLGPGLHRDTMASIQYTTK